MNNIELAKEEFLKGNYTFVMAGEGKIITNTNKGLSPIIELIESGDDFSDYAVCDKITGRAAAFLYVLLGIEAVHAKKMAKLAIQILDRAEIKYSYDEIIETVLDSEMKEIDPVELSVLRSGSAVQAINDIKSALSK